MAETKIIYHIDEEETPYLVKLPVPPEKVTLTDFKHVLSNRPLHSYKFFFKSMDQDFGYQDSPDLKKRLCPMKAHHLINNIVSLEGATGLLSLFYK